MLVRQKIAPFAMPDFIQVVLACYSTTLLKIDFNQYGNIVLLDEAVIEFFIFVDISGSAQFAQNSLW